MNFLKKLILSAGLLLPNHTGANDTIENKPDIAESSESTEAVVANKISYRYPTQSNDPADYIAFLNDTNNSPEKRHEIFAAYVSSFPEKAHSYMHEKIGGLNSDFSQLRMYGKIFHSYDLDSRKLNEIKQKNPYLYEHLIYQRADDQFRSDRMADTTRLSDLPKDAIFYYKHMANSHRSSIGSVSDFEKNTEKIIKGILSSKEAAYRKVIAVRHVFVASHEKLTYKLESEGIDTSKYRRALDRIGLRYMRQLYEVHEQGADAIVNGMDEGHELRLNAIKIGEVKEIKSRSSARERHRIRPSPHDEPEI